MELVVASHNLHKIREFRDMLKAYPHIDLISLLNFPNYVSPKESGSTLQENCMLKAEHAAKALNKLVLADDSGLFVPSLGGAPGVYSRRYAGDDATDSENRQKLLAEMEGMEDDQRIAYFECCLALATPEGVKKCVTGKCEGIILRTERGNHGFGYDPLFQKYDYDKTFAELDESTKNRMSHRRKALEKILPSIEAIRS